LKKGLKIESERAYWAAIRNVNYGIGNGIETNVLLNTA
jgi:hypothetical protein